MHSSNHIKFADDTTVVGLISKNDKKAYREEVQRLMNWCRTNNLPLNLDKTKEMVVDFRRTRRDHSPLNINGSTVEIVKSNKFLGVHLAEDLTWSLKTSTMTKKAQQCLYFLQRLRKAHFPPPILTTFYRGAIESILSSCITAWFGNCTASDRKSLQRVVRTAEKIIGVSLPTITDIYTTHCIRKATSIVGDHTHLTHTLHPPTIWKKQLATEVLQSLTLSQTGNQSHTPHSWSNDILNKQGFDFQREYENRLPDEWIVEDCHPSFDDWIMGVYLEKQCHMERDSAVECSTCTLCQAYLGMLLHSLYSTREMKHLEPYPAHQ
ncbi:hypothetical protein NFI96_000159 [Prochilodus magdalenae]|nr:hypothetical protein NFI96_000159 [Prochilodus magdalenae]